jgi:uncharacterized protein (TIGR00369 family)
MTEPARKSEPPKRQASTTKLEPLAHGALHNCFGCGQNNKTGLRLKFLVDEDQRVHCRAQIPQHFQGPPGYVHGGVIATLLDEAMSKANRQFGILAMTRQMEVEYLKPVPLNTPIQITAHHRSAAGRKHHCEAEITSEDGTILARGRALFIAIAPDYLKRQSG